MKTRNKIGYSVILSEDDMDLLKHLAENCRDDARIELFSVHPTNPDVAAINTAVAEIKVRQSNLIRKTLIALGCPNPGPEWMIKNHKVIPVSGT